MITIKLTTFFRCRSLAFAMIVVSGLSACTPLPMPSIPIPQFPGQPPQPQAVPQADPLPANVLQPAQQYPQVAAPVVMQRPAAVPVAQPRSPATADRVQRQGIQPQAQVSLPPMLSPVRTARAPLVDPTPVQQRYAPRPSASVSRAPTYYQDQTAVNNSAGKTASAAADTGTHRRQTPTATVKSRGTKAKTAVRSGKSKLRQGKTAAGTTSNKPATRPAQQSSVNKTQAVTATPEAEKKEVLDMSGYEQKPTAAVKTEKDAVPARSYASSPAVSVLMKQAGNHLSAGKKGRAAATLERALRIAPDNPMLWLRLAEVNAQQGNKSQATSMARKAMDIAPNDAGIQSRAQRLIND